MFFKVNLKFFVYIYFGVFFLIKILYLEFVEFFYYGINFVMYDDIVFYLKVLVFGISFLKFVLYLIIYYIEMDLLIRKNGKIRFKMYKDGIEILDFC